MYLGTWVSRSTRARAACSAPSGPRVPESRRDIKQRTHGFAFGCSWCDVEAALESPLISAAADRHGRAVAGLRGPARDADLGAAAGARRTGGRRVRPSEGGTHDG